MTEHNLKAVDLARMTWRDQRVGESVAQWQFRRLAEKYIVSPYQSAFAVMPIGYLGESLPIRPMLILLM